MGDGYGEQLTFTELFPDEFPEEVYAPRGADGDVADRTVETHEYLDEPIYAIDDAFTDVLGPVFGDAELDEYVTRRATTGEVYRKEGTMTVGDALSIEFEQKNLGSGERFRLELSVEPSDTVAYGEGLEQALFDAVDTVVTSYQTDDREYETGTVPDRSWDDIVLPTDIEEQVEDVVMYLEDPERFQAAGLEPVDGMLVYGPTGTGKTLLAEVIAAEVDAGLFSIGANDITHSSYGKSEEIVADICSEARAYDGQAVVFVDEAEGVSRDRDGLRTHEATQRIVQQFLKEIDGFGDGDDVFYLLSTNHPGQIDDAVRGRLDTELELGLPEEAAREQILDVHTQDIDYADEVDLEAIAQRTADFSGRDLRKTVEHAKRKAFREARAQDEDDFTVTQEHFEYGLDVMGEKVETSQYAEHDRMYS